MAQSPTQPDEAAIRARITTHMNAVHRDSLSLFLQHYCHVPPSPSTPGSTTLVTLHLDSLILASEGKRYYIPLHPPMASFSEIRPRMKAMHQECLDAFDLSDVKITSHLAPQTLIERAVFISVVLTMLAFSRRGNFVPGSIFYETFGMGRVPNFASFCARIQPWLIVAVLAIHVAEALWMARTRLRRHRVRRWSRLWCMWLGSCFIDGFFSFRRFDGMVRENGTELEMKEKQ